LTWQGPCRPSPENKPINGFEGPLPFAGIQGAEPLGGVSGAKPRAPYLTMRHNVIGIRLRRLRGALDHLGEAFDQRGHVLGRYWAAEQIALHFQAALGAQHGELRFGLDALGGDGYAQ